MDNVLLAVVGFLAFIILFTLAVRYGAVFAGRIMGRKVYATHHAMETILDTEKIPPEWLEPPPREPAQAAQWQDRQKRRALEKLAELHKYAENTPAFEDAESRLYVLDELERIQNQWTERRFDEITVTPGGPSSKV